MRMASVSSMLQVHEPRVTVGFHDSLSIMCLAAICLAHLCVIYWADEEGVMHLASVFIHNVDPCRIWL